MQRLTGKRVMDVTVAGAGLVVAALPMAAIAAAVRASMGRPVLFRQARPGLHGEPFTIWKFRTMRGTPGDGTDAERITPLGRALRDSSLDELPELWNILKGDMSLVGPRPLLMEYLPRYSHSELRRHEARPGLTGYAQVAGRNSTTWPERLELDLWYVDHRSLTLDLWILWRTLLLVVRREGVSHPDHATMPPFRGEHLEPTA